MGVCLGKGESVVSSGCGERYVCRKDYIQYSAKIEGSAGRSK